MLKLSFNLGIVGNSTVVCKRHVLWDMYIHPYIFDVSNTWETGENSIVIEVTTNPGYMIRDNFSGCFPATDGFAGAGRDF